ncbi:hypothetical protein CPB84DRAFT_208416 [Gymnopilus junonius]|uniref:Uncharacterized protein n=1 Tax=Gymnopilus junonius TaxID=109634 RepID=A0A9P5NYK4_GYMJU|nr:hypothetical protein CPB84DRAFT_208416 [Gymnopilus junonius]
MEFNSQQFRLSASNHLSEICTIYFRKDVRNTPEFDMENLITAFLQSFTFRDIQGLSLSVLHIPSGSAGPYEQVFERLTSVTSLNTTADALQHLKDLPSSSSISSTLFPELDTIELEVRSDNDALAIKEFLESRIRIGKPIQTLHMVLIDFRGLAVNIRFQDQFPDLKTVIKYIRG